MKLRAVGDSLPSSFTSGTAVLAFAVMMLAGGASPAWAAPAATITTLSLTASGSPVTNVPAQTVITLKAAVTAGGTALTTGQVKFCDEDLCTDIHLLGTQQLTSAGTAVMKFTPGPGNRKYKAVFLGKVGDATSSSPYLKLTVTPAPYATSTTMTQSGTPVNYKLSATVSGIGAGGSAPPSGKVSFVDTSSANTVVGSGVLYPGATKVTWPKAGAISTEHSGASFSMAVADFNGDGKLDVVAGILENDDPTHYFLNIFLGDGNGNFSGTATGPMISDKSTAVAVGDFNADGIPDLVSITFGGTLNILLGRGDGTIYPSPNQTTHSTLNPGSASSIAIGDFNRDGIADFAVANYNGSIINVLLGNGDGTFTPMAATPATGTHPRSLAIGDFNGDTIPDLVATGSDGVVALLLGNGDGTFTPAATDPGVAGASVVLTADFNLDGKADLALLTGSNVTILLGNGDSTFYTLPGQLQSPVTSPVSMTGEDIALGDFNGDGIPDVIVLNDYFIGGPFNIEDLQNNFAAVVALLGAGDGRFTTTSLTVGDNMVADENSYVVVAADFTGNGVWSLVEDSPDDRCGCNGRNVFSTVTQASPNATAAVTGIALPDNSGTHQVEASYPGDTNYIHSSSAAITLDAPTQVILTPTSLSFSAAYGYSTESKNVTLINHGADALAIQSIRLTGSRASLFITSNNCPRSLPAGASCRIGVRLAAADNADEGDVVAAITVTDNAPSSPQTVTLAGFVGASNNPTVVLSAPNLSFGSVPTGYTSSTQWVTLTAAFSYVDFKSIVLGGPSASSYAISNTCGVFILAGHTCKIGVRFIPQTVAAAFPATITITDDADKSPSQTITLSGSSFTPATATLSFSSSSITLPYQDFFTSGNVNVTNTGGSTAYFASIALGGANAGFYVTSNTCGVSLAAGATCHIGARLNPAMPAPAPLPASITVVSNAAHATQVITLSEATGTIGS